MKLVIFGLTVSSSWGNGHATLWRGLCQSLGRLGHQVVFFEHDTAYYAGARDCHGCPGGRLILYPDWSDVAQSATCEVRDADVVMVSSYCPDALEATELAVETGRGLRVFYDLDTPVTLSRIRNGQRVGYIGPRGLIDFDLVLSFTGGATLTALQTELRARRVAPLYGHVDAAVHRPVVPQAHYAAGLSYLGTYSQDRQAALEELLVGPARRRPEQRFLIGGAQYPPDFPWSPNIYFVRHLPPAEHPAFFSSSRLTLNVTRASMAEAGWCPSGRLFEASACQTAVLSDAWPGIEDFFTPGAEILLTRSESDTLAALDLDDAQISRIARAARERVLDQHTSDHRARELCGYLGSLGPASAAELMEA
jgi:spore maturation protein CgeB